jgi:hypothetical protein
VDDYMAAQVVAYVEDAWVEHAKTKLGYEIPLTRLFYKYAAPRSFTEIDAEIKALEIEIQELLREVTDPVALKRSAMTLAGQSPPSEDVSDYNGEGLPFLQGNAEFGARSPRPTHRCDNTSRTCELGDSLISVRAPVGALTFSDRPYGIGRGLCAVRAKSAIDRKFLWWLLHGHVDRLMSAAVGSTLRRGDSSGSRSTTRGCAPDSGSANCGRLPRRRGIPH